MNRSNMTRSARFSLLTLFWLWAYRLDVSAWQQKRRDHRRTSQILSRMAADDSPATIPVSLSSSPTEFPTQGPTPFPSFSTQRFLDRCEKVSSYYDAGTCDCSTEDNSIICELPGSTNFPFQYVLFEYDEMTGKIGKGSECYCKNEANCGSNAADYCLSMTMVGQQNCAIKFLQDGAQCSNNCVPCVDDVNTYGVNIDGCFSGGESYGCISLEIEGAIGENHNRSLAPPDFLQACDDVSSTYPKSGCRCYVGDLRMDCSLGNTTEFDNVFLSFLYDSNLTKITDGLQCFCDSDDCGASPSDYCIQTALLGDPICNITILQSKEVLTECCDVCNSDEYYGVNTDQCYKTVAEPSGCFTIGIDKTSGENHALGTSEAPSISYAPSLSPSLSLNPSTTPSQTPSLSPLQGPSVSNPQGPSVSFSPTGPPVPNSTQLPTQRRTPLPSSPPAKAPTMSPTLPPSPSPPSSPKPSTPSSRPTNLPSSQPTSEPTKAPTEASVVQIPRTSKPTGLPTHSPSSLPPTNVPTTLSTRSPTNGPSGTPTTAREESSHIPSVASPLSSSSPSALLYIGATQFSTITATGDTYIYKNGFVPLESAGDQETMLVQNGPEESPDTPDTYALISFSFGRENFVLSDAGSTSRTSQEELEAKLCLQHVKDDSPDAVTTTYSICRIDTSARGDSHLDVDIMNASSVSYSMPNDCVGKEASIVDFEVAPNETEICIDISETLQQPIESSSKNRHLAPEDVASETVLFMIDNLYSEQQRGDLFYTSNYAGRAPEIIINSRTTDPSPSPTPSSPPLPTPLPTPFSTLLPISLPTPLPTTNRTSDVTLLTGQSNQSSEKNRNGLYSLLLLVLLVPVAWFVVKRYKKPKQGNHDVTDMPSQVEIRSADLDSDESGFGDEEGNRNGEEEKGKEQHSLYLGNELGYVETGSILEGQHDYSDDNVNVYEGSEEESSESEQFTQSSEDSTVEW